MRQTIKPLHDYDKSLRQDIGKTILSRDKKIKGTVTNVIYRMCTVCGYRPVYSVKWENGRRTFPCPAGCEDLEDGNLHID